MKGPELQPVDRSGILLQFPAARPRYDWFSLWHLLSLDAPTVAVVWMFFVAHAAHVKLPWASIACMFVAVWALYVGDRLLDARDADNPLRANEMEERHWFHFRHRGRFVAALVTATLALAWLAPRLNVAALVLYVGLASLLAMYFLLIHLTPYSHRRLPKEFAVGVFFAAAMYIPTVARRPDLRVALLPSALVFAATCTLNCLYLYLWEHPRDRSSAHGSTQFATKHLEAITAILLLTALLAAACCGQSLAITLACAASVCALFLLHRLRGSMTRLHLRAAADLALLTPLLVLPFLT